MRPIEPGAFPPESHPLRTASTSSMSPKSVQRFWDNDMRKNKSLQHDA
jgi:hypothetical protein